MKIVLITGASSGLGEEFARQIDRRFTGIDEIWLVARREDRMRELASELVHSCRVFPVDLCEDSGMEEILEALTKEHTEIKILVNAAGFGRYDPFLHISLQDNLDMIRLNCLALTRLTYEAMPYLNAKAMILNIASAAAFVPQPDFAVYAASKSYVLSFTRAIKRERTNLGIRMTAVCPGPVKTEFFQRAQGEKKRPAYKDAFLANCSKVVKKALDDGLADKDVSIYGGSMKILEMASKVLPHDWILRASQIGSGKS